MAGERTINPYATHGPSGDTGPSWAEYFRNRRPSVEAELEPADSGDVEQHVGDELGSGEWPGEYGGVQPRSLVSFAKLLQAAGFETKGKWATTFYEGGVYGPAAQKAGEKKPDRTVTAIAFAGVKPGYGYCRLLFEQVNEGSWKCEWRNINGEYRAVSDTELKEWIKNAD